MKIWWRKIFRVLAFLVVGIGLLGILAIAWFGYQSHKEWTQTRSELLARGEKLLLTDLAPSEIPPEENFFADPLWEEVFDLVPEKTTKGIVLKPRIPVDQQQISQLARKLNASEIEALKQHFPEFATIMDDAKDNMRIAMECRRSRTNATQPPPAPTPREAEFILALLEPSAKTLQRIAELAKRPSGRAPLRYEDGIEVARPHGTYPLQAAQLLSLRAEARLTLGDFSDAWADTFIIFRLAQKIETEPLLIPLLTCARINEIGLRVVKQGIPFWSQNQLEEIESLLTRIDLVACLARAWRGERGAANLYFDDFQKKLNYKNILQTAYRRLGSAITGCFYRFWLDSDGAFYNRIFQELIVSLELERPNLKPETPKAVEKRLNKMFESSWVCKQHIFTIELLPAVERMSMQVASAQNNIRQGIIVCALQRWVLDKGSLPEKLDDLVPFYVSALPPDVITGVSMHYRRTSANTYDLWSVGWNERDEGGTPCNSKRQKLEEADWVWNAAAAN